MVETLGAAKILGAATPSVSGMPGTRPRAPEMLMAEAGDGQVVLTWKAPSFGGTPTGYEVSSDGGKTWTATGSTDLSYTVMGLTNGQGYVFLVAGSERDWDGGAFRVGLCDTEGGTVGAHGTGRPRRATAR